MNHLKWTCQEFEIGYFRHENTGICQPFQIYTNFGLKNTLAVKNSIVRTNFKRTQLVCILVLDSSGFHVINAEKDFVSQVFVKTVLLPIFLMSAPIKINRQKAAPSFESGQSAKQSVFITITQV